MVLEEYSSIKQLKNMLEGVGIIKMEVLDYIEKF
jgi:hypothetical protein